MRFSWLLAATALVTASAPGCVQRSEDVGTATQAIQGGTVDMVHRYAVGVRIGPLTSPSYGICSGTLIAPNVVVTARHCVDNSPSEIKCAENPIFDGRKTNSIYVTTHHQIGTAPSSTVFAVTQVVVPQDDHICGNDIALLVLDSMVPSEQATPVIPGVQYPMNDSSYLAQFTAIGYGTTSPSGGGSGTRRYRMAIPILCIPGDKKRPCPPEVNPREFVAGDGTCAGDSGSGAFEQNSYLNNFPVNFGVLSRGGQNDAGTVCQGSIYTRLDQFRDLVIDTVRTASNNWQLYPEPQWTTYVPPKEEPTRDTGPGKSLPLGEACTYNEDCASGACLDPGTGFVCTQACSDQGLDCPEGFTCQDELCFAPVEAAPAPSTVTKTTTEGCTTTPESGQGPWIYAAIAAVAVAAAAARRGRKAD